jgi:hypothetical protein
VTRILTNIEIWGIGFAYIGMAIATQRIAHNKGRNAEMWLFYAGLLPGVSPVHALLLDRRSKSPGPAMGESRHSTPP